MNKELALARALSYLKINDSGFSRETRYIEGRVLYCDCSGFISLILNSKNQKAFEFFDQAQPTSVVVNDITPGQILCWKKVNPPKSGDTGHILLIKEILHTKESLIRAQVIDSSKVPRIGDAKIGPGVREIDFIINSNEELIGLKWAAQQKVKRCPIRKLFN